MGLRTDAGGEGTREGLATELCSVGRTCVFVMFLVAICCLII